MSKGRLSYRCPVCTTRVEIRRDAEVLVLLQGAGDRVDHVVTSDDDEIHRCQYLPDVRHRERVA